MIVVDLYLRVMIINIITIYYIIRLPLQPFRVITIIIFLLIISNALWNKMISDKN